MKIWSYAKKAGRKIAALILCGTVMASCHSIYDDEGDCSVTYRVKFRYDMNMKFADAFAHEVEAVTLYVIDENGNVVWQQTEQGEVLSSGNYAMDVKVAPGTYDLLAWCGTPNNTAFTIPQSTIKKELTCTLNREREANGTACVRKDIGKLYHGYLAAQTFSDKEGIHTFTLPLVKNTNTVRVVLQHLSGEPIDKDKFIFSISDDNGSMDWDNSLQADEPITYYAWHTSQGTAETTPKAMTSIGVAIAELTTARLMADHNPRLTITNTQGEMVLSIPLVDYALLVKGEYNRAMNDQEYLDRQDEYNLVFFLDEKDHWFNSYIYINSWKVVLQTTEIFK